MSAKKGLVVLAVLFLIVATIFVYQLIIEPLMRFERLEIFRFFGWTANSDGEIRQASFHFFNNGTKDLSICEIWVDGTFMKPGEWGCYFGSTLESETGERVFIAPEEVIFENGKNHNFTIGTSSGNRFSFIIEVDEESIKPENLTIIDYNFGHLPQSGLDEYRYVGVRVRNFGDTPVIVTKVEIDEIAFNKKQWVNPHTLDAIMVDYEWRVGDYVIHIETAAGNTYDIPATAEYP